MSDVGIVRPFLISSTLHLVLSGQRQTVVCSDSRGHGEDNTVNTDDFEKLFCAGDRTACCMSGILFLPPAPGVRASFQIASLCGEDRFRDAPRKLLTAVRDSVREGLSSMFAYHPLPDLPSIFTVFTISRKPTNEVDILELDFPIMNGSGRRIGDPTISVKVDGASRMFLYHHSRGDCLPQDITNRVHPDSEDKALLSGIDNIFSAAMAKTKSCSDEIGGPIDVAVIDASGFRWIRQKASVF